MHLQPAHLTALYFTQKWSGVRRLFTLSTVAQAKPCKANKHICTGLDGTSEIRSHGEIDTVAVTPSAAVRQQLSRAPGTVANSPVCRATDSVTDPRRSDKKKHYYSACVNEPYLHQLVYIVLLVILDKT